MTTFVQIKGGDFVIYALGNEYEEEAQCLFEVTRSRRVNFVVVVVVVVLLSVYLTKDYENIFVMSYNRASLSNELSFASLSMQAFVPVSVSFRLVQCDYVRLCFVLYF